MPAAISTTRSSSPCNVMAVIVAYGLPLAYPLALPYLRRTHPEAMPGVHDVQHRLNQWLTGPGTVLVLVFGVYISSWPPSPSPDSRPACGGRSHLRLRW
jgi:hypothetical protein